MSNDDMSHEANDNLKSPANEPGPKRASHKLRRLKQGTSLKSDESQQATLLQDSQILQQLARSTSMANIDARSPEGNTQQRPPSDLINTSEQPVELSLSAFHSKFDEQSILDTSTSSVDEDVTMELDAAALLLGISRPKEAPAHGKTRALRNNDKTQPNAKVEDARAAHKQLIIADHEADHTIETDLSLLSKAMMAITNSARPNDAPTREIRDVVLEKPSFPDPLEGPNSAISNPAQPAVMTTSTLSTLSSANIRLTPADSPSRHVPQKRTIKVDRLTTEDEFKHAAKMLTREIATQSDNFTNALQEDVRTQIKNLASEVATDVVSNRVFDAEPKTIRGDMNQLAQQIAHRINTSELDLILGPQAREALNNLALDLATELEREALEMAVANEAYASDDHFMSPEVDDDDDIIIAELDDDPYEIPSKGSGKSLRNLDPNSMLTVQDIEISDIIAEYRKDTLNDTDDEFDLQAVLNPDSEPAEASQPDINLAPQPDINLAPQPDIDLAPQPDIDLAPQPDIDLAPQPEFKFAPKSPRPADTIREGDPAFQAALENVLTVQPEIAAAPLATPRPADSQPSAVTAGSLKGIRDISDNRVKARDAASSDSALPSQSPAPPPSQPQAPQRSTPQPPAAPSRLDTILPSKRALMITSAILTFIATVMATAVGLMMYFR